MQAFAVYRAIRFVVYSFSLSLQRLPAGTQKEQTCKVIGFGAVFKPVAEAG